MSTLLVCRDCPACGRHEYRKIRPNRAVAFAQDRVCLACGTKYSPPTPRWASTVFLIVGSLLLIGGCLSLLIGVMGGQIAAIPLNLFAAGVGVICVAFGVTSLRQRITEPPVSSDVSPISNDHARDEGVEVNRWDMAMSLLTIGIIGTIGLALLFCYALHLSGIEPKRPIVQQQGVVSTEKRLEDLGARCTLSADSRTSEVTLDDMSESTSDHCLYLLRRLPPPVTSLTLRRTVISGLGVECVSLLEDLTSLRLECPNLTDAAIEQLKLPNDLKSLSLRETQVTNTGIEGLLRRHDLAGLTELALDETRISSHALEHLHRLTGLKRLSVAFTAVDDADLTGAKDAFPTMEVLILSLTLVSDKGLEQLVEMSSLRELSVIGTECSPDGVDRLRKALPNCKVYY